MTGKQKKIILIMIMVLMVYMLAGCEKDYDKLIQNHSSLSMKEEGVWDERYTEYDYDIENKISTLKLSIVVNRDMNEDEILEVLDYYNLCAQSIFLLNRDYDGDVTCHAVFYKVGEKDDVEEFEEYKRIKYMNGEIVQITDEDTYEFPAPYLKNKKEDVKNN